MGLLVDIGNSRIKWSDRERLLQGDVSKADCTELEDMLENDWCRIRRPDSVWISSVATERIVKRLTRWAKEHWDTIPVCAETASEQLGVVNGYTNPAQLGIDRWLSLIGARDLFNRALIIVDCGTATTIDAMDQGGRHLGGLILPGMRMMRESLLGHTAIPEPGMSAVKSCFAQDTATGIDSGRVLSTVCLIERVKESLKEKVGGEVNCVLTGGSAEEIKDSLTMNFYHEPNLVLQGLALVARANDS